MLWCSFGKDKWVSFISFKSDSVPFHPRFFGPFTAWAPVPIQGLYSFNSLQVICSTSQGHCLHPSPQKVPSFFSSEFWSKSSLYQARCQT